MSARGAAFLGIGAMVGAGIFALLGEAGAVAGSAVWLSFLIAGIVMAIAAPLATASSVNAPIYASGGLTSKLAEVGQFPTFFGTGSRLGAHAGLMITSGIVLVVSNVVDLSAIASVGSACSLLIFLLVGVAGYRRRAETGSHAAIVGLSVVLDFLWKRSRGARERVAPPATPGTAVPPPAR